MIAEKIREKIREKRKNGVFQMHPFTRFLAVIQAEHME